MATSTKVQSLKPAAAAELSTRFKAYVASAGLAPASTGQIQPIDGNLASEPVFAAASIQARVSDLLPRWTDVYINDLDREIPALTTLKDRYNDLNYRATVDLISQYEFDQNEKVHNDEIAAGWYDIQKDTSALEFQSQQTWADASKSASDILAKALNTTTVDWTQQDPEKFAAYKANAAVATMFSVYSAVHAAQAKTGTDTDYTYMTGDIVEGPFDHPPTIKASNAGQVGLHSVPASVWGLVKASSLPEVIYNFASINSQMVLSVGAATSAQQMATSKSKMADWNAADAGFRRERTQIALDVNAMRNASRGAPRGALNLGQQLTALRSEFIDRFADVYARCSAISAGLPNVWGMALPAPLPDYKTWDDTSGSYFDALTAWVRVVKRAATHAATGEINTVVSISIASTVGAAAWTAAVNAAATGHPVKLTFKIQSGILGALKSVRLKGVIGYSRGPDDLSAGTWRATLQPPGVAAGGPGLPDWNQDQPIVDLGRVQTREVPRPPDVVGLTSLRNILPVSGTTGSAAAQLWTLQISPTSLRGVSAAKLKDLELDLLIAGAA